jgi:hypothetical protein
MDLRLPSALKGPEAYRGALSADEALTKKAPRVNVLTAPARDTPTCFVGYRCYEPSRDDLFEKW